MNINFLCVAINYVKSFCIHKSFALKSQKRISLIVKLASTSWRKIKLGLIQFSLITTYHKFCNTKHSTEQSPDAFCYRLLWMMFRKNEKHCFRCSLTFRIVSVFCCRCRYCFWILFFIMFSHCFWCHKVSENTCILHGIYL